MSRWSQYSLTVKQRNAVLRALRAEGRKPPKVGYCVKTLGGEVCRHRAGTMGSGDTGYQVIGISKPGGFDGLRRKRRGARRLAEVRYPLVKNIKKVTLR